jgi:sugar phosphate isomerase/epimerase
MHRRDFLKTTALTMLAANAIQVDKLFAGAAAQGVGMCDWNLGPSCDPELIPKAAEADLRGLQVSVGRAPDDMPLRDKVVRDRYIELGKQHDITFHSVAAGSILNKIPLASEPQSAVYVIDAIEAAAALGAQNILMAFFGNGDLRKKIKNDQFIDLKDGDFSSYELDEKGLTRVVEALRQIVPRAEDAGVVLGLENTLTAKQNLEIIERVGSPMLQVYYDIGNSTAYGYDVPTEIRLLGNDRICEVHIKDWQAKVFSQEKGQVNMTAAAAALADIGFDKWYCLETSGRKDKFIQDTKDNVQFVKNTFRVKA